MNDKEILGLLRTAGCSEEVIEHCRSVAELSKAIAERIPGCDAAGAYSGGLIHDIGRSVTHGITHAVEGVRIAAEHGADPYLLGIIRCHIGAGITKEEAPDLGLPEEDFIPETILEKVVTHADNLISGTRRRTMKKLMKKLEKRGVPEKARKRFTRLHSYLSELAGIDLDLL